jgi:phosphatidylinositol glycan class Z
MKPGSVLSRGLYFGLVLVRLYFALSPSYIHPDEHLQGPEVLTGDFFHWQVDPPWEFVSANPIRSIFPLWVIYGVPLSLIRTLSGPRVDAITVFRGLRMTFFLLSFANGETTSSSEYL